jgi:hypothetical protein
MMLAKLTAAAIKTRICLLEKKHFTYASWCAMNTRRSAVENAVLRTIEAGMVK